MYKIGHFLIKYCIITYFVLVGIINFILGFVIHSETVTRLLDAFLSFIIILIISNVYHNCPLKRFRRTCKLDLFQMDINFAEEKFQFKEEKELVEYFKLYYNYYSLGPCLEVINELENYIENPLGLNLYLLLFLCLIEIKDEETFIKYKNKLLYKIASSKKNIIRSIFAKEDNTLFNLYELVIKNDVNSEKVFVNDIEAGKFKNRLDKTVIYYFLSLYYNQNSDSESEKKVLKKVIEFGDETYMAKNARERLKKLNS